ncbi:MAG: NAD(P)/FAD-dependent oxidoreductase [Planctomycetota bacterium]
MPAPLTLETPPVSETRGRAGATRPRVVILGAGFGGLRAARELKRTPVDVVVIDRQNHHLFQPLLYQVATAGLSGTDIAAPIRRILGRQKNARVLYADVTGIDVNARVVQMGDAALAYDHLIVATGATHSYFGHDDWAAYAPGLKTLRDAQQIRSMVLGAFEQAERLDTDAARMPWLRMVIVGAGPTGVELAGAIAELARKILPRDFKGFDPKRTEVLLVEAGPRVLSTYDDALSASARQQLTGLGVTVRTDAKVTQIDAEGVTLEGGERIEARTVLWAAGVQASPILRALGAPLDRAGRALVAPDLSVPGHPEVVVIGDAASLKVAGAQVPGVAPAATQMGALAARNIRHALRGEAPREFRYVDKGAMATIGRASAVAQLGRMRLRGFPAWVAWLFVHLLFLVGYRSRIVVLINWAWQYIGYRPVARVFSELAGAPRRRRGDDR